MKKGSGYVSQHSAMVEAIDKDTDFKLYGLLVDTSDACVKARGNELSQYGISPIEARVLFVLQSLGTPSTPAEIAKHVYREHNTVSALINRMIKKELVTKTRDNNRKNLWRVELTEQGIEVVRNALKIESVHTFLADLSREERIIMESCLSRIQLKALKQIARDTVSAIPWVAMHNISI